MLKSEPDVFSIDDLQKKGRTRWDGVRNYAARNNLRKMKQGDLCLFYHSSCTPPGAAGLAKVVKEAYPDYTAWDPKSPYYDAKIKYGDGRWSMVDVEFVEKFTNLLELRQLRAQSGLADMVLFKLVRLSVQPITQKQMEQILQLAKAKTTI